VRLVKVKLNESTLVR